MAKSTQAAKVGVFALLAGGAVYGVYRYVSPAVSGSNGYTVHGFIRDATGLATHSRVTIAGIPVGSLDAVKLERGEARLDVKVQNDVVLYDNATLGKKSTSLLGEAAVVLTPGTPDHRKLRDGDEIPNIVTETSPADLMQEVKEIADDIKQVTQQLARSLGTNQGGQNITAILQNLADATDAINATVRENRDAIRESLGNIAQITQNTNPELAKILENLRIVTQDVRDMMASNQTAGGQQGDLRDTIEHLDRSSKSLENAIGHVDNITGRIDRGEGTVGRLTKDEALINEVQGVAEGVNDYVQNLTRLQTVVGLRTDYNFLSNSVKTYVQLRLQPREDKYYLFEIVNDPRGAVGITTSNVDTTQTGMSPHYQTTTTTLSTAFLFSLEFAKRVGPFTGRFGIIESTGGAGLDLHLLQDRVEIQNDIFGFALSLQAPRYRVSLSYEFIKHLWLLGGVDHVFDDPNLRDYFFGLTLRFTDEDLKSILPFAGGLGSSAK